MTGMVGNKWSFEDFSPMEAIPSTVCLTTYSGGPAEFMATPLNDLAAQVAAGTLRVQVGRTFHLDEIVAAHPCPKCKPAVSPVKSPGPASPAQSCPRPKWRYLFRGRTANRNGARENWTLLITSMFD